MNHEFRGNYIFNEILNLFYFKQSMFERVSMVARIIIPKKKSKVIKKIINYDIIIIIIFNKNLNLDVLLGSSHF